MEKNKNEQVIFVKDLVFSAFYKWRWIVAMALVFALVLGGIAGIIQWKNTSNATSENAEASNAETKKQQLDKAVEDAQMMVASQEEYNLNSIIMNLNPYSVYKATLQLTVLTNDDIMHEAADTTSAVLQAYSAHLNSDKVIDTLAQQMKMESKYLAELITTANSGSTTKSLTVNVVYPDKAGAEAILNGLKAELEKAAVEITEKMGEHSYSYATSVDERVDLTIIDKQNEAIKRQDTLLAALATAQQQRDALDGFPLSVVLFAVLGAFLGAALVAGYACFKHIISNKVYSARVLRNRTGLRVLDCVPANGKKNAIDQWLRKLEGRSLDENCLNVAAANVRNYCLNANNVLITGDCSQADMAPVADALKNLGVNVAVGGSLLRDPSALEKLPSCDCVLLIEKCGCSEYANILLSAERIADQNKPLLGCVLIEG